MNLKFVSQFSLILMLLLFSTCQKERDNPVGNNKVELGAIIIDTISYYHCYISTHLTNPKNTYINSHGFCWSTQPTPDITKDKIDLGIISSATSFSSVITNVQPNQKYYVRAYATITGGTIYGTQCELTTMKTGNPLITTDTVTDITLVSASSGGNVLNDSGFTVTARGICWDMDSDFDIDHCLNKAVNSSGTGHFTSNMTGLSENTVYYVKAYATNQAGTGYGETMHFSTLTITLPTVTTNTVTSPTDKSAVCGGNVTSDGNGTVTARGVCWNTAGDPTLINSIDHTTDGIGTGPFISNISNLAPSTTYYVKAYATNSYGTSYGLEISFYTLNPWSCGSPMTINHIAGNISPVSKIVTYGTVTNIPGEPSKCWVTSNLGADHQATSVNDATEASAGWYWQFNKTQGFKHNGTLRTPNISWLFPIIDENSDWTASNDPCTLLLGSGWRIPSQIEWTNVDGSSGGNWNNWNDPWNSVLKIHASGYLHNVDGSLMYRGSTGFYWSSSQYQGGISHGWILGFDNFGSEVGINPKGQGFSIRCLRD